MAQELEDLLIKVDSECGDLKGIDSAINALSSLASFSQNAQKGASAITTMAGALNKIDSFGRTASGIKKAKDNVDDLVKVLEKLSQYTGKARESIAQLSLLGKALQNFSGLGTSLKGLDKVANGINDIVDAMHKLAGVTNDVKGTANVISDLGKSMDFSKQSKGTSAFTRNYIQQLKKIREASKQGMSTPSMDVSDQIKADTDKNVKAIDEATKRQKESLAELAEMFKSLSQFNANDLDKRREQGFWFNSKTNQHSKIGTSEEQYSISSELKKELYYELKEVQKEIDSWVHSHPSNTASFSGADIKNALAGIDAGLEKVYISALKEISSFDISKINKSDVAKITENFDDAKIRENFINNLKTNVKQYEDALEEQGVQFSKYLYYGIKTSSFFNDNSFFREYSKDIENSIKGALNTLDPNKVISMGELVKVLDNNVSDVIKNYANKLHHVGEQDFSISDDSTKSLEIMLAEEKKTQANETFKQFSTAFHDEMVSTLTKATSFFKNSSEMNEMLQAVAKSSLKDVLSNLGYDANEIYKSFPVEEFVNQLKGITDGINKDNSQLENAIKERLEILNKLYDLSLIRYDASGDEPDFTEGYKQGFKNLEEVNQKYDALIRDFEQKNNEVEKLGGSKLSIGGLKDDLYVFDQLGTTIDDEEEKLKNVGSQINSSASGANSLAQAMQDVADNTEKAVKSIGRYSEFTNAISKLASQNSYDSSERAFFANTSKNYASKSITGTNDRVTSEQVAKLYSELESTVNSFLHSHPYDIASFSPADISSGADLVADGITKQYVLGLKEISTFDFSKVLNKSLIPNVVESFRNSIPAIQNELLKIDMTQMLSSGVTEKFGELFNLPLGLERGQKYLSETLSTNLKNMFDSKGIESSLNDLRNIISDEFKNYDFVSVIDADAISSKLSDKVVKAFSLSPETENDVKDKLNNTLLKIERTAQDALFGDKNVSDKLQSAYKDALKNALTSVGEDADSIYKSFPLPDYMKALSKGLLLEDKAPQLKNAKFNIGAEKGIEKGAVGSLEESIKLLNEFREAIEKFEGIGDKLSGVQESLKGIKGIIGILKTLSEFTGQASDPIAQLKALGEALQQFGALGVRLNGLEGIQKGIYKMIDVLKMLSEYQGKAGQSIAQFGRLGEALHKFSELGKDLEGLDAISKGVNKMVDTLIRLSEIEGNANKSITQLGRLGEVLHKFNGLDDSLVNLNEISIGLINLGKATESMKGTSFKDFEYITNIATALNSFDGVLTGRQYANVAQITSGLASLISALQDAKKIDVGSITEVSQAIQNAFNNDAFTKSANKITSTLNALTKAYQVVGTQAGTVKATMTTMVESFVNASTALYKVRENIEAIATDFTDALQPVTNSALFETLEHFKRLNDSYKNVAGLGQGLGSLLTSLDALKGKTVDVAPLVALLTQLDDIAKKKNIEQIASQFQALGNIAQPVGYLLNAMKYTDLTDKNNVLTVLAGNLTAFYNSISELKGFSNLSYTFNAIKDLINLLKSDASIDPNNNVITQISASLQSLKGFDGKSVSSLLESIKSIGEWLSPKKSLYEDSENSVLDRSIESTKEKLEELRRKREELAQGNGAEELSFDVVVDSDEQIKKIDASIKSYESLLKQLEEKKAKSAKPLIDTTPITDIAEAVSEFKDLGNNLKSFATVMRSLKGLKDITVDNLKGVDLVLERIFETMSMIPEGREDVLKGLASALRAIDKLQNIEPEKLTVIADGLSKIFTALGSIQGSNNKINISLHSDGVAEFQKLVDRTDHSIENLENRIGEFGTIDYSSLFDFEAPVKSLKKQLYEAERTLRSTQRRILEQKGKIIKTELKDMSEPANAQLWANQRAELERLQSKANDYVDIIHKLRDALTNMPPFETDAEGYKYVHNLQAEYKNLEKTVKRITKDGKVKVEAESREGRVLDVIQGRMEQISAEMQKAFESLKDMDDTEEGLAYRANEIADAWNRTADEAEKASQAMRDDIGKGFSSFGSMLKGSKSGVLGSFGNLSDMFGKAVQDGTAKFSGEQLASYQKLAGVLGTVSKAIGQVGAVASVVISIFQAWWKLTDKIYDTFKNFLKGLLEFAKNMRSAVVGAFNAVAGAVGKMVSAVKSGAEIVVSALRKIGEAGRSIISIFSKVGGALVTATKGFGAIVSLATPRFVKTLASTGFQLKKILKNMHLLKGAIKSVTRYFSMLTRMLMRKSITAFLNGMKQAFEDMVLFEKNAEDAMLQLNYNVSIVFSALRRLANQVMAIFEPIINAVAVPIETFLTGLQAMAENVAKFMAILTGQPYYLRAKKFYEDYGQNLEDTNKKAKNLTNSLDELNILNDSKDSSSSQINPEDMFEKVPVEGSIDLNFPSLKEILDALKDWLRNIPWDKIKEKVREIIHRIMSIINEILKDLDLWGLIGDTIGELFNTLMVAWNQFITDFDPVATANALAELIIRALNKIDWDLIHENIELTAQKFAQFWNEIFANDELWDSIIKTITNFLNEIVHYFDTFAWTFDFEGLASQLTRSLTNLLKGFDYEQLRHAVEGWVTGLVNFINKVVSDKEFWKTLGESVASLINSTLVEALKDLTGLDFVGMSDSIKIAITSAIDGIKWEDIKQSVKTLAENITKGINDFFGDEEFLTKVTTALAGLGNTILTAIKTSLETLEAEDIGNAIGTAIGNGLATVDWDTVFSLPSTAINKLSEAIKGLLDSIPDDFNLGTWLAEHLKITLDGIDWELIHQNVEDFATKVSDYINGLLADKEFWKSVGSFAGETLDVIWDLTIKPLANVNLNDLVDSIKTAIREAWEKFNFEEKMGDLGGLTQKIIDAVDHALTTTDWRGIGKQIGDGISAFLDKINPESVAKTIFDAFVALSDTIGGTLEKMIEKKEFVKLGQIIANAFYGALGGLAYLVTNNKAEFNQAMNQLLSGINKFLADNEDNIVAYLNKIIDGLAEIIQGWSKQKTELINRLSSILEKTNLAELLGTIIGFVLQQWVNNKKVKSAVRNAIFSNLFGENGFFASLFKTVNVVDLAFEIAKAIMRALLSLLIKVAVTGALSKVGGVIGSFAGPIGTIVGIILGFLIGNLIEWIGDIVSDKLANLFGIKKKDKSTDTKDLEKDLQDQVDKALEDMELTGEAEVDVDTTYNFDDPDMDWDSYYEARQNQVIIDDPKFGTITASKIESEEFAGKILNVDEINAQVLNLGDIFADKLKVKEIIQTNGTEEYNNPMDKLYAGAPNGAEGGVLGARREQEFDKITTKILEVIEKTTTPLLEVGEKLITPIIEVTEKITSKLLEITEKITTPLLVAEKITTQLLEALKITTPLLEAEKIFTQLFETLKITTPLLEAEKLTTKELEIASLKVATLLADNINATQIKTIDIIADRLKVGVIDGQLSGGTSNVGGTTTINLSGGGLSGYDWMFGDGGTVQKPTFAKGDRWSDISGLAPHAEDFLDGIEDMYGSVLKDADNTLGGYTGNYTMPKLYADNESDAETGTLADPKAMEEAEKAIGRNGASESGGLYKWAQSDENVSDDVKELSTKMINAFQQMADGTFNNGNYSLEDVQKGDMLSWFLLDAENQRIRGKATDEEVANRYKEAEDWLNSFGEEGKEEEKKNDKGMEGVNDKQSSVSKNPLSFLENLPLQTEYIMAQVYDIIDKWLGRIYKLLKSFEVPQSFLDLFKDMNFDELDGDIEIPILEEIAKKLDILNYYLSLLLPLLKQLKDSIDKLESAVRTLSNNVLVLNSTMNNLISAIKDLINKLGDITANVKTVVDTWIHSFSDDINRLIDAINSLKDKLDDISATATATAEAWADSWADSSNGLVTSIDGLKDAINNVHIDTWTDSTNDLIDSIRVLGDRIDNIKCECTCCCNCKGCDKSSGKGGYEPTREDWYDGGDTIPDNPSGYQTDTHTHDTEDYWGYPTQNESGDGGYLTNDNGGGLTVDEALEEGLERARLEIPKDVAEEMEKDKGLVANSDTKTGHGTLKDAKGNVIKEWQASGLWDNKFYDGDGNLVMDFGDTKVASAKGNIKLTTKDGKEKTFNLRDVHAIYNQVGVEGLQQVKDRLSNSGGSLSDDYFSGYTSKKTDVKTGLVTYYDGSGNVLHERHLDGTWGGITYKNGEPVNQSRISSFSDIDTKLSKIDIGDSSLEFNSTGSGYSVGMLKLSPSKPETNQAKREAYAKVIGQNGGAYVGLSDSDAVKAGFASLRDLYNALKEVGYSPMGINPIQLPLSSLPQFTKKFQERMKTKGYQMGGVPNSGEIFVARENGIPEFVGSFGNRSVVANNDQIVTAVANGVSMANDSLRNAIEAQTNALEQAIDRKDLDVKIGDRQIAEANRRGQEGMGTSFVK